MSEIEVPTNLIALNEQIRVILTHLTRLNDKLLSDSDIVQWFKKLCEQLSNIIIKLAEEKQFIKQNKNDYTLLLYLNQIITALSLLMNVFIIENSTKELLFQAHVYVKKIIETCLLGIQATLSETSLNCTSQDIIGSFLKWMDRALDKISKIDKNQKENLIIYKEARILFEEVLCHAMSIAQITIKEDYHIIRGSSQTVLNTLDVLSKELSKEDPNGAMINLLVNACFEKLCMLERRVNTAVLKLCLKVFSEYTSSLETVHNFCSNTENHANSNELDSLIINFDLHVDRIMQIGLFAVSCSTCTTSCLKIKNCLASLEALEAELIPAFSSMLLDNSRHNVLLSSILKNHWLDQAKSLWRLINLLIDPQAFFQVVYEQNNNLVDNMSETMKNEKLALDKTSVQKLIQQSDVLRDFISLLLVEDQEINDKKFRDCFADFKNVLHEVKSACNILLTDNRQRKDDFRVLKRCKILLNCIRALQNCITNTPDKEIVLEDDISVEDKLVDENRFLNHIINKGNEILKNRSILYKSSNSESVNIPSISPKRLPEMKHQNKVPLPKLVHIRKFNFIANSVSKDSSCELQITDILNELNNLSTTIEETCNK